MIVNQTSPNSSPPPPTTTTTTTTVKRHIPSSPLLSPKPLFSPKWRVNDYNNNKLGRVNNNGNNKFQSTLPPLNYVCRSFRWDDDGRRLRERPTIAHLRERPTIAHLTPAPCGTTPPNPASCYCTFYRRPWSFWSRSRSRRTSCCSSSCSCSACSCSTSETIGCKIHGPRG
jgi:hypothetical protein